jgi:hypothetical protein
VPGIFLLCTGRERVGLLHRVAHRRFKVGQAEHARRLTGNDLFDLKPLPRHQRDGSELNGNDGLAFLADYGLKNGSVERRTLYFVPKPRPKVVLSDAAEPLPAEEPVSETIRPAE